MKILNQKKQKNGEEDVSSRTKTKKKKKDVKEEHWKTKSNIQGPFGL